MITARGGSTRILGKNLKDVSGIPLVGWSIIQARSSKLVDDVALTTDSEEIASVGLEFGARVFMRPVWDNGVCGYKSFLHGLTSYEKENDKPDLIVEMFPTSPLRKPDDIDNMIKMYTNKPDYCEFVTNGIPLKELFVCKNDKSYQDRFGTVKQDKGYIAREIIGDKFWNYTKPQWGTFVASRDYFYKLWSECSEMDIDNDTAEIDSVTPWFFYPMTEWQFFDIDYPDDLVLTRILIENYILKGQGRKVYDDYMIS